MMFTIGWFANPIFGLQNLTNSFRLPQLTIDEQRLVKGSSDFLGLTHYTSVLVENHQSSNKSDVDYDNDQDVKTSYDADWSE